MEWGESNWKLHNADYIKGRTEIDPVLPSTSIERIKVSLYSAKSAGFAYNHWGARDCVRT